MDHNSVEDCLSFFETLRPDPTNKHIHVQLGCHFEEVKEMLDEITPLNEEAAELIAAAKEANHNLAEFLKSTEDVIRIEDDQRVGFLDAACDQMVTAIGSCHMLGMDIVGGFNEVNESNLSKFEDGKPVFDANGKGAKGRNYRQAVLEPFV